MSRVVERIGWWVIPVSWIPYVALRLYWRHILATVPGAEHGELSGPVTYFLPRLLWAGAIVSIAALATSVVARIQRSAAERKRPQNQPLETTRGTQP